MIVRYLLAALAAGLLAGILMTPVHMRQVVPIILHAEEFEGAAKTEHAHVEGAAQAASEIEAHVPAQDSSAHGDGRPLLLGRFWNTVMANLVTGAGFALLLCGVSLISGVAVRFSTGVAWGAAGWLAAQFLPGIGLPPELPGFPYVDLAARQYWWMATVAASVAGLALLFLHHGAGARVLGIALLLAPHVYGAPRPADISAEVPAFLAAEFVMAALSTTLFFWLALGLLLGFFMDRYGKSA
jgi:cobalt transporter subunit CbtA